MIVLMENVYFKCEETIGRSDGGKHTQIEKGDFDA